MATKHKLQYVWLDGTEPMQHLRCKTQIVEDFSGKLEDCPMWSFDGSSTNQASGGASDCLLKPVAIITDPVRKNGFIVMTEVMNADGTPPRHQWPGNHRRRRPGLLVRLRAGILPLGPRNQ